MAESTVSATPAESLGRYAAALRRWWPLAVAIVVIGALAGLVVAAERPKSFTATAKVLVGQQRQVDVLLGNSDYSPDPERELNTSLQLITLEPIAAGVSRSLRLGESPSALVRRVSTAVDRNSNIVTISVADANAERAAAIANAFAAGYRDYRARSARAALDDAITAAHEQMLELPPGSERAELRRELTRVRAAQPFQTGGVQVVHEATATGAVRHPRPLVSALLGGFLGLIAAAVAIAVLARTDRRVSGDGDLEDLTGRHVVARIPRARPAAADALMTLALSLAQGRIGGAPAGALLLTSPGHNEGTPEVAVGLTQALGALGLPAIAIEADLRAPRFARSLAVPETRGLKAVLDGTADLADALADIGEGAEALPAGSTAALPQPLLASAAMAAVVEEARRRATVVLIASAPAGLVGDPVALAAHVDAALLVVRDDVTRPEEVARAMRALTDAGIPPVGIVATVAPARLSLVEMAGARLRRHAPPQAAAPPASEVTAA
jgi:Mrp family chromosome partitioning ATPase